MKTKPEPKLGRILPEQNFLFQVENMVLPAYAQGCHLRPATREIVSYRVYIDEVTKPMMECLPCIRGGAGIKTTDLDAEHRLNCIHFFNIESDAEGDLADMTSDCYHQCYDDGYTVVSFSNFGFDYNWTSLYMYAQSLVMNSTHPSAKKERNIPFWRTLMAELQHKSAESVSNFLFCDDAFIIEYSGGAVYGIEPDGYGHT